VLTPMKRPGTGVPSRARGENQAPDQVRCRRCRAVVGIQTLFMCSRSGRRCGTVLRTLECECRGVDDRGLLVIPGPTITADEKTLLGGEIIPVRAADLAPSGESACEDPACERIAVALCDFATGYGGTCDRRICRRHRTRVAAEIDRCPEHAATSAPTLFGALR
jgi:hypothetical protein